MKGVKTCLGYKHSDEARKNMSDAHKGKKLTQEQKEKISASGKLAWAKRKERLLNGEN